MNQDSFNTLQLHDKNIYIIEKIKEWESKSQYPQFDSNSWILLLQEGYAPNFQRQNIQDNVND